MSSLSADISEDRVLLARYKRLRSDPIYFLQAVRTLDQVDKRNPIKPFPIHLEYIQFYVKLWVRERLLAIPKSRRMKMSWTNIALYTWDTMFNVGRHNAFVSKKEDDSEELVKRAKFIVDNLDREIVPEEFIPAYDKTYNKLRFPQLDSMIEGFPSGDDQLRQFTLSGMLWDEAAFWDNIEKAYAAAFPTIEGGGRFTLISSPSPGFFKRLVHDELDQLDGNVRYD